jgi:hypothetical protein
VVLAMLYRSGARARARARFMNRARFASANVL